LSTTDTFGLYMLLGGVFFLLLFRKLTWWTALAFGLIAGLMHLTRADGLLWLGLAFIAILFVLPKASRKPGLVTIYSLVLALLGYLIIMGPWFYRNLVAFGTLLAPGGTRMLWLTSYNQIFTYPASRLSFAVWRQAGFPAILESRFWSLGLNLANAFSVQWEIFLLPLIAIGFWQMRKDRRIQFAGLAWLLVLGAMTVVFPFAGARGGFFHSGAAVQTIWWVLAPLGLDRFIEWGRQKRGWEAAQAGKIFGGALVGLAILLTGVIFWGRVVGVSGGQPWGWENTAYRRMDQFLVSKGKLVEDVVMVANPPGFFLASGNPSIAVPDGDIDMLLAAAQKYNAIYLILEDGSVPSGLMSVYNDPQEQPDLIYLGEIDHATIFLVRHH
jgi:hypothetical protein